MSNLVIVAIPDENDRVWKVSSEKKPHLTLLFLGDADKVANADEIVKFVEHAASLTLAPFYLPVDRRDVLGDDKADVLFFKKGRWGYKEIRDFRVNLLKDDNIRTAYDSSTQFEGPWQPHLTLGYPDTPAKPDDTDRDYGFYDVSFNKIGVWFGDFDGPEFLLKDRWDEWDTMETAPIDVAMADQDEALVADFMANTFGLEHYGVKGMRWGHRKSEEKVGWLDPQGHDLNSDLAKTAVGILVPVVYPLTIPSNIRLGRAFVRDAKVQRDEKADAKFEKVAKSHETVAAIHNGSVDRFNSDVKKINAKYTEADLAKPAKKKAYDAEILKSMQDSYKESANKLGNKRGTKHLDVEFRNDGMDFVVKVKEGQQQPTVEKVKHADIDDDGVVTFEGKIKRAPTGHIVGFEFDDFKPNPAIHSAELGAEFMVFNGMMSPDEFLEHFGVKGMRWGVRKEDGAGAVKTAGKGALSGVKAIGRGIDNASMNLARRSRYVQAGITQDASKALKRSDLPGIKANHPDYNKLTDRVKKPLSPEAKAYRKDVKAAYLKRLEEAANQRTNIQGNRRFTLAKSDGTPNTSQYFWRIRVEKLAHADLEENSEFTVQPIFDADGYIVDIKMVMDDDELTQAVEYGADFLIATGVMTEEQVLEHFGVKGMRWGVRKEHATAVGRAAKSTGGKIGKAAVAVGKFAGDVHFEGKIDKEHNPEGAHQVEQQIKSKAHEAFHRTDLPAIKDKPEYQKAKKLRNRLRHPKDPATKAYRKEVKEAYISRLEGAANSMTNTSGTRQYTIRERGWETPPEGGALPKSKYYWDVTSREIKHADGSAVTWTMEVNLDEDGFVDKIAEVPAEKSAAHSIEEGAYFLAAMGFLSDAELEHYGVKGMRWGVRRGDRPAPMAATPAAQSLVPHGDKRKTKIEVAGGQNHEAHPDALNIAESKAKLKKSGVNALSNKELQDMAKRLQLENQVALLNSNRANKFIQRQLEQQGQQVVQVGVRKGAKVAGKKAAKTAIRLALL